MTNRPAIPMDVQTQILVECGHRCAVCGTPIPLEKAHIIPWHESRDNKAENLICLCANCHERADQEKWGETALKMYKEKPWVLRYPEIAYQPGPRSKVKITFPMEIDNFDERQKRLLKSAIAGFLEISPETINIDKIEKGSVKVTITLPTNSAQKLLNSYKDNDKKLQEFLSPFILESMIPFSSTGEWFSVENLEIAWNYAKHDLNDDFLFDIIDHADIKSNIGIVLSNLHMQLKNDLYYPAPLIPINIPKNDYSYRPGSTIHIVDLIVVYAIIQQLAPLLDALLSDSAYAYRLNPRAGLGKQGLFKDKESFEEDNKVEPREDFVNVNIPIDVEFPYNWFISWKEFHELSKTASKEYDYAAVTDITAYFENISLDLLRENIKEKLGVAQVDLIDRLFRLLEYWDWNPTGNLPRGLGLPQGNDVSSFLSNIYLIKLDKAMLEIVKGDISKYYRYVDDIKLFTSNRSEAQRALISLEEILRTLNLNVQSSKTKIVAANELFDNQVETWLEKMAQDNPEKLMAAREFLSSSFSIERIDELQRPYLRSLSILREGNDDSAVNMCLEMFVTNPSYRLLTKNFIYLRHFSPLHSYTEQILDRLKDNIYTFAFHRAYLFRLSTYCRDESDEFKDYTVSEALNSSSDWLCRMSALICANSFTLSGRELENIHQLISETAHPLLQRAAFIVLCQNSGEAFRGIIDRLSNFNSPRQEYLRRYMIQLYSDTKIGGNALNKIEKSLVSSPMFISNYHIIDILKSNKGLRGDYNKIIQKKIQDVNEGNWPRLSKRLIQVQMDFIEKL